MAIVTKEYIQNFLTNNPEKRAEFIGRALVVIFNNQTEGEKAASVTNVDNGVGFTGGDAHSGCISAKYFLKHRSMLDWQIERWMKPNAKGTMRIAKYWRQLDAEAQRKASKPARVAVAPVDRACVGAQKEAEEAQTLAKSVTQRSLDAEWREQKSRFAEQERKQEERAYRLEMEAEERMEAWFKKLQNA
jgi:hypothetical protein